MTALPPTLQSLVGDSDTEVVWTNEVGGLTYRLGADRFLKWSPNAAGINLERESARLRWAAGYNALPVAGCPFGWSVSSRLARACFDQRGWHPEHRRLSPAEVRTRLAAPPPIDQPVVCHGDAIPPLRTSSVVVAFQPIVPFRRCLTVPAQARGGTTARVWEEALLDAYGIAPDAERIAYYRLLWDVTP